VATYLYRARRRDGSAVEGSLPADSEQAALATLDRLGLFPLELSTERRRRPRAAPQGEGGFELDLSGLLGARRIGSETAARIARELADLVRAGVPILAAIDAVGREPRLGEGVVWGARDTRDDQRARLLLADVRRDLAQGSSLADALAQRPELFAPAAVSVVRAGEEGGFLDAALRRVAAFAEREQELSRKVRAALAYPAILTLLSGAAVVFLLTWVVPRFASVYADLGGALPAPTRILMATGDFLAAWGLPLLVGGAALALAAARLLRQPAARLRLDALALRIPLLRAVVAQACLARFGRTVGTLLASGVGILRALEIGREAVGNREFARRLAGTLAPVREGAPLAQPLRDTRLFPPQVVEMVDVGQESGTLAEVLEEVGDRADAELDHALRTLVTVLEPTLIVSVAGVVFFVVLAALLPVFSLNSLIQ